MTTPAPAPTRQAIDPGLPPAALWAAVAEAVHRWAGQQGLALRDAVLLLPFAALLPPARLAFAARGGWAPRIETVRTLAESLAPPVGPGPGHDDAEDRLAAAALLGRAAFGADWQARDPRGSRVAADAVAAAAGALARGAAARPASERAAYWTAAQRAAAVTDGPGAMEQALLKLAVTWAADEPAPDTDVLFAHRPSAWMVLQAGGPDPIAAGLVRAADVPALWLGADPPADDPYAAAAGAGTPPTVLCCDHFEAEAQVTAHQVLQAVAAGETPLALVALDRELVRRVRALLERSGVALVDETGWKLSTSRAGARVMAWLRAAHPHAAADARLAWLKGWPPARRQAAALQALEARWRRDGPRAADTQPLWEAGRAALAPLSPAAPTDQRPLQAWCEALAAALADAGEAALLADDAAGAAVLQALRLDGSATAGWQALARSTLLSLTGFTAWVDAELEAASFCLPPAADAVDAAGEVVLTPLPRALLRPFARVIVPGVDARHLGGVSVAPGLIGDSLATALGLETAATRRLRERLAFAHLLRVPAVTLLRRRLDNDEPLAASPELQWLALRRRQAGLASLVETAGAVPQVPVQPAPVPHPQPTAPLALPESLSASQVEQLRRCPYQFYARTLLRLSEPDELDRAAEKRDYGRWLHAVLHRFHREGELGDDAARLAAAAEAELAATGFEAAELLPYRASFTHFAPLYLAWWQARAAAGWQWQDGETERRVTPPALAPTGLHGRLDRIDQRGGTRCVVDYKTGRADGLKKAVKTPTEDTQLAFYAALLAPPDDVAIEAGYLTLDDPKAPELLLHPGVQQTAMTLVHHLGQELQRMRDGAALPALGEGRACEFCEVRGLCRRDHWAPA